MQNRKRTTPKMIVRAAMLYHRGVICPAESWRVINDAAAGRNVVTILNALRASEQEVLRSMYQERPSSLESLANEDEESQFTALLAWCGAK